MPVAQTNMEPRYNPVLNCKMLYQMVQVYRVARETGMSPEMFCRRATAKFQVVK